MVKKFANPREIGWTLSGCKKIFFNKINVLKNLSRRGYFAPFYMEILNKIWNFYINFLVSS